MFCKQCGKELMEHADFCTGCGTKQNTTPIAYEYQKIAEPSSAPVAVKVQNKRKGKGLLFGVAGMLICAIILGVVFFASGIFSSDSNIEGPGFGAPEDAAKAYLTALREQDIDAMVSTFVVETYADHYNLEAFITRLNGYMPNLEMRLPNTSDYLRQMNIESRRNRIVTQILNQYIFYQAPSEFNNGEIISLEEMNVSDFVEDFEKDTSKYVFEDLSVIAMLNMQNLPDDPTWDDIKEVIPKDALADLPIDWMENQLVNIAQAYKTERNQDNMAQIANIYGADIDDIANVVVFFEANNDIWIFCPEAIRYNGKWYLETQQGNLASLAGLPIYTGGILPVD